eukprot:g629.t1
MSFISEEDLKIKKVVSSDFLGFGFEAWEIKTSLSVEEKRADDLKSTWFDNFATSLKFRNVGVPNVGSGPYNNGLWTVFGILKSQRQNPPSMVLRAGQILTFTSEFTRPCTIEAGSGASSSSQQNTIVFKSPFPHHSEHVYNMEVEDDSPSPLPTKPFPLYRNRLTKSPTEESSHAHECDNTHAHAHDDCGGGGSGDLTSRTMSTHDCTLSEYRDEAQAGDQELHDSENWARFATYWKMLGHRSQLKHVSHGVQVASVTLSWNALIMAVAEVLMEILMVSGAIPKAEFRVCFLFLTVISAVLAYHTLVDIAMDELVPTIQAMRVSLLVEVSLICIDIEYIVEAQHLSEEDYFWRVAYRSPYIILTGVNVLLIIYCCIDLGISDAVFCFYCCNICARRRRRKMEAIQSNPVSMMVRAHSDSIDSTIHNNPEHKREHQHHIYESRPARLVVPHPPTSFSSVVSPIRVRRPSPRLTIDESPDNVVRPPPERALPTIESLESLDTQLRPQEGSFSSQRRRSSGSPRDFPQMWRRSSGSMSSLPDLRRRSSGSMSSLPDLRRRSSGSPLPDMPDQEKSVFKRLTVVNANNYDRTFTHNGSNWSMSFADPDSPTSFVDSTFKTRESASSPLPLHRNESDSPGPVPLHRDESDSLVRIAAAIEEGPSFVHLPDRRPSIGDDDVEEHKGPVRLYEASKRFQGTNDHNVQSGTMWRPCRSSKKFNNSEPNILINGEALDVPIFHLFSKSWKTRTIRFTELKLGAWQGKRPVEFP